MEKVSVIIRSYNEQKHLPKLFAGLARQRGVLVEAVLVDSGSTDDTVKIARSFNAKIVSIPSEEFSFGRALNIGCRAAESDTLVLASAHVYPTHSDWLCNLIAPFRDDRVGMVYGRQIGDVNTRYSESRVFERWFPRESVQNQGTPFCNNANAAIRKCIWEAYGYNETLPGLEDVELANRMQSDGLRLSYSAEAQIVHVHDESASQIYNRYRREAIAFKQIFPREHLTMASAARLVMSNILSDACHAYRDGLISKHLVDIAIFRSMQFLGAYQGFRQKGPVSAELAQRFYYPSKLAGADYRESRSDSLINYTELAGQGGLPLRGQTAASH
ncbi:glycosyltransferase [Roseiconus lacunae]|uniref:glycosyltransferase n=1 Tax=Roseiconus lacunae TaxID=2605694 RepID=UPI001E64EF97|nr:glycosyltransferase [Roseiconus lacunae]MCD0458881.1 glycosyltransferase [Roseiconus lacunae]